MDQGEIWNLNSGLWMRNFLSSIGVGLKRNFSSFRGCPGEHASHPWVRIGIAEKDRVYQSVHRLRGRRASRADHSPFRNLNFGLWLQNFLSFLRVKKDLFHHRIRIHRYFLNPVENARILRFKGPFFSCMYHESSLLF